MSQCRNPPTMKATAMSDNDSPSNDSQASNAPPGDDAWLNEAAAWWSEALSVAGKGFRDRMDADAKREREKPAQARIPDSFTQFDLTFQKIVPAKLEGYIQLGAYMVGQGLEDFSDAHWRVMQIARKYGAGYLSEPASRILDDWISQQILACIDEPAPLGLVSPDRLAEITGEPR